METNDNSFENLNDLVFENRNKEYGAYMIRKSYNDNLLFALFSAASLIGIITLAAFLFTKNNNNGPNIQGQVALPDSVSIAVNLTPPETPETKIEKVIKPKVVIPKSDNLNLQASDDKKDVIEKGNVDVVINKNGKPEGVDSMPPTIGVNIETPPTPPSDPMPFVDQMPEFNGNLFKYLKDNLQYPRSAIENGTSGTVVLQFVVENDGSIGNLKILNPIGDGCTEEAIRVVKSMPKWKPGKNHGEPSRVLFNLPVKFTIK